MVARSGAVLDAPALVSGLTNVFYGGRDYEALYHEHPEDEAHDG